MYKIYNTIYYISYIILQICTNQHYIKVNVYILCISQLLSQMTLSLKKKIH